MSSLELESISFSNLLKEIILRVIRNESIRKTFIIAIVSIAIWRSYLSKRKSKSVKNKLIVLTGAATGLGRAQAFALAEKGAKLVLWDINEASLMETVEEVRKKYPNVEVDGYKINLANRNEIYELAARVQREKGFVWGLWNNAGIIAGQHLIEEDDKKIELTMSVNIMAHFWTTKAFLPAMMEKNSGHIVGISSAAGFFPSARMVSYCASKHAARGFMESLRIELSSLGKGGVGTTGVYPAHINTDLFKGYNMVSTMEPEWVATQIIDHVERNQSVCLLPWTPLAMGIMWQGILPVWLWDIFMLPTNQSLNQWKPDQAEKIFSKMQ